MDDIVNRSMEDIEYLMDKLDEKLGIEPRAQQDFFDRFGKMYSVDDENVAYDCVKTSKAVKELVESDNRCCLGFYSLCLWESCLNELAENVNSAMFFLSREDYWFVKKRMAQAIDYGIEGLLEALYAGVPYDDIVADLD